MTVIEPLSKQELKSFFDDEAIEALKYFMIKSLFAQPEKMPGQTALPLQIPKEHIEQWFTQALDVSPVGAGSYPIDIYDPEQRWGADIKMLSIDRNADGSIHQGDSGEASLGQNFKGVGRGLDGMFEREEYGIIKDMWLDLYKNKFVRVADRYPVNDFYYFFLIRCGKSFYLTGAKLDLTKLVDVEVDYDRSNPSSTVWLKRMIDSRYGNTKVYKAKKRLELRLRPREWVEDDLSIEFRTNFMNVEAVLREELSDESFKEKAVETLRQLSIEIF